MLLSKLLLRTVARAVKALRVQIVRAIFELGFFKADITTRNRKEGKEEIQV
jgi:hypothetical protein